jgi:hypothetical protein
VKGWGKDALLSDLLDRSSGDGVYAVCCAVASADQNMYLNELQGKLFVSLTNNQALQLGNAGCGAMRSAINSGMSMGKARHQGDLAVANAAQQIGIDIDLASAMHVTEAAEHNLC